MIEVYSILNQASPDVNPGFAISFYVFWGVIFLILLISLIKKLTTKNARLGRIVGNVFAMVFIIVACVLFGLGVRTEKQTYAEYTKAYEAGSYYIESGNPDGLEVYSYEDDNGKTVYGVSFWINGKYFDSSLAYGGGHFSKNDLKRIASSEIFEVKYIVDEYNDNIILSMSVAAEIKY